MPAPQLQTRARELQRAFDESFAAPLQQDTAPSEQMLVIEVAGEQFTVRLGDVSGLQLRESGIVRVPSEVEELVGLVAIRGVVVPVFSLAALLGLNRRDDRARWLLICGHREMSFALAFDEFEKHVDVLSADIFASDAAAEHGHVPETLRHGAMLLGVISVSSLLQRLKDRGQTRPGQEKT